MGVSIVRKDPVTQQPTASLVLVQFIPIAHQQPVTSEQMTTTALQTLSQPPSGHMLSLASDFAGGTTRPLSELICTNKQQKLKLWCILINT